MVMHNMGWAVMLPLVAGIMGSEEQTRDFKSRFCTTSHKALPRSLTCTAEGGVRHYIIIIGWIRRGIVT